MKVPKRQMQIAIMIITVFLALCLRYGCVKSALQDIKGYEPEVSEVVWYMLVWSR